MPVTTIDPQTALIVIDLQKGIVANQTVHPAAEIVRRASTLAAAFRSHGLPVVLVNVDARPPGRTEQSRPGGTFPPGFADLVSELNPQPGDHHVTKQTPGAFTNTGLDDLLKNEGTTQVVVAGVSTSMGVESTVRQAYELGFNVTVATDAVTDRDPDTHHHSVARIFPRMAETGTTDEILALLDQNSSR